MTTQDARLTGLPIPSGKDFLPGNSFPARQLISRLFSSDVELLQEETATELAPPTVALQLSTGQTGAYDIEPDNCKIALPNLNKTWE